MGNYRSYNDITTNLFNIMAKPEKKEIVVNSAMAYVAFLNVVLELCDNIEESNIFSRKEFFYLKKLTETLEKKLDGLVKKGLYSDKVASEQIQRMEKSGVYFMRVLTESNYEKIEAFHIAMENFINNDYIIEE